MGQQLQTGGGVGCARRGKRSARVGSEYACTYVCVFCWSLVFVFVLCLFLVPARAQQCATPVLVFVCRSPL